MKDWQNGYELDYLLEIEARYASFNSFSQSPFSSMKKNTIAAKLKDGELRTYDSYLVCVKETKVRSEYPAYRRSHPFSPFPPIRVVTCRMATDGSDSGCRFSGPVAPKKGDYVLM